MTMSSEAVNEKISAWFEPPETLPTITTPRPVSSSFPSRASHRPGELSAKGAWKVWPGMKWRALDYFTSEDANARLLEAMPEVDLSRDGKGWRCDPYDNTEIGTSVYDPDRKTAIVLAFCKFAGIEVEG